MDIKINKNIFVPWDIEKTSGAIMIQSLESYMKALETAVAICYDTQSIELEI